MEASIEAMRARFRSRIRFDPATGCVVWTGSVHPDWGYGRMKVANRTTLAHRVALMLAGIDVPRGQIVRHVCDNPPCVNVDHLIVGTHQDNMDDMRRRHRGTSSLSATDVFAIREAAARGESHRSIAPRFGVTHQCIQKICAGKRRGLCLVDVEEDR